MQHTDKMAASVQNLDDNVHNKKQVIVSLTCCLNNQPHTIVACKSDAVAMKGWAMDKYTRIYLTCQYGGYKTIYQIHSSFMYLIKYEKNYKKTGHGVQHLLKQY